MPMAMTLLDESLHHTSNFGVRRYLAHQSTKPAPRRAAPAPAINAAGAPVTGNVSLSSAPPPPAPASSSLPSSTSSTSSSSSSDRSHGTETSTSSTYHSCPGPRLIHAASVVGASTTTSTVRAAPRWISTGLYCNPNAVPASGPLVIVCSGVTPWSCSSV